MPEKALGLLWLQLISDIDTFMKTFSKDTLESGELKQAIDLMEKSAYTKEELEAYERYWDSVRVEKALISDALREGFGKGRIEGQLEKTGEMVISGYREGIQIEVLARMAKLTPTEVEEILLKNNLL